MEKIQCPGCGGTVYAPTFSGICTSCYLLVFPDGTISPAPRTAHSLIKLLVDTGAADDAWHDEVDQIAAAHQRAALVLTATRMGAV